MPLYRPDSPAVELGVEDVGSLDRSQVMIAIPHHNTTDEDTFVCPDDPSTPDLFESGDEVDGAFRNGGRDVNDIGIVHDLATVLVDSDDRERKEIAKREEELIRAGVLVPQPIGPDEGAEDEAEEDEENENEEEQDEEEREDEKAGAEDDERKRDDESEGDEQNDASSGDEDDGEKGEAARESSDHEDGSGFRK